VRKIMILSLAFLLVVGVTTVSLAEVYGNVNLKASVTGTLSVAVEQDYQIWFGTVTPGSFQIGYSTFSAESSSVTVRNTSTGVVVTYWVKAAVGGSDKIGDMWWVSEDGGLGADKCAVQALFKSTAPVEANFAFGAKEVDSSDVVVTTTTAANVNGLKCTTGKYACDDGSYCGADVSVDGARNLWFRFGAPTTVTTPGTADFEVTVTAKPSSE